MEIKGKVILVLEAKSGSNANGDWTSQDFVIETTGQYPKKVCLNCFKKPVPKIDENVTVQFEPESREYNGKWFTNLNVWKFDVEGQSAPTQAEPMPTTKSPTPTEGTDLPFN